MSQHEQDRSIGPQERTPAQEEEMQRLSEITDVVCTGSIDSLCAVTALLRVMGEEKAPSVQIHFTQAFDIDKVTQAIPSWNSDRKIMIINLAPDRTNPEKTEAFIHALRDGNHTILGVSDEHDPKTWLNILDKDVPTLLIKPEERNIYGSSSGIFNAFLKSHKYTNETTLQLLEDGNKADQAIFTGFGELFNKATKRDLGNNERREKLVRHFSSSNEPDEEINGWIKDYEETIPPNHKKILENQQLPTENIVALDVTAYPRGDIDLSVLLASAYTDETPVAVVHTPSGITIGTNLPIDLVSCLQNVGLQPGGSEQKVTLRYDKNTSHEEQKKIAVQAVQAVQSYIDAYLGPVQYD